MYPATVVLVGAGAEASPGRIAFASNRDGNNEIYLMKADGSGPMNVTNDPASDFVFCWSPDGSQIAFASDRFGNFDLFVISEDGGAENQLTTEPSLDSFPSWSPDGRRIAFTSDREAMYGYDIYAMDTDGTNPRNLTEHAARDYLPAWSPNGETIAYSSDRDGDFEIYVMDEDGSNQRNLSSTSSGNEFSPAWSPDGTKVAFSTTRDGNPEIYVMNADGSNQSRLTRSPASDVAPSWSPDGRRIVFTSYRDGNYEVYTMDADGANPVNLTNHEADDVCRLLASDGCRHKCLARSLEPGEDRTPLRVGRKQVAGATHAVPAGGIGNCSQETAGSGRKFGVRRPPTSSTLSRTLGDGQVRDPFLLTVSVVCGLLVPAAIGLGYAYRGGLHEARTMRLSVPDERVLLEQLTRWQGALTGAHLEAAYEAGAEGSGAVLAVHEVIQGDEAVYRLVTAQARQCRSCGAGQQEAGLAGVLLRPSDGSIVQVIPLSGRFDDVEVDTAGVMAALTEILPSHPAARQGE